VLAVEDDVVQTMPSPQPPEPPPIRLVHFDKRRELHYVKPTLRGWFHLVWFEASLVLGTLLIATASGAAQRTAASIYAGSVSGLFGVSALYHRGNWTPRTGRVLQRLDHTMIFLLIAGTATPAFILTAPRSYGVFGLSVLWALTLAALITHLVWMTAPEKLVGATFIGLGFVAGLGLPPVWMHAGVAPATLLLAGGLLYIAGAITYHRRRPDPAPAIFGYHEVFHACVCAAAACQYIAIAAFVL
jgi:hemolysin III